MSYCGDCGKECDVKTIDNGIGHYEFWGQKGVDRQMDLVSACCEYAAYEDEDLTVEADEDPAADAAEARAEDRYNDEKAGYYD